MVSGQMLVTVVLHKLRVMPVCQSNSPSEPRAQIAMEVALPETLIQRINTAFLILNNYCKADGYSAD
jgi:hypothetical protein